MLRSTIPVHILTGFLGSGKTSLLIFIKSGSEEVVVMKSGCVCCSIRTDLATVLMDLANRASRGLLPLQRVIIETSGISAPEPIMTTLRSDFNLLTRFHIGSIVSAVDATALEDTRTRPETLAQIAAADVCIVTKRDLAGDVAVEATQAWLQRINPIAIVAVGAGDNVAAWFGDQPRARLDAKMAVLETNPLQADDCHGIQSCVVRARQEHSWPSFATWLSLLIHLHGDRILRMKGVLWDSGRQTWIGVHSVRRFLFPPEHIESVCVTPDNACLVFITEHLDPVLIERSYHRWMASHEASCSGTEGTTVRAASGSDATHNELIV